MNEYRVSWAIDIYSTSPEAAAERAENYMRDPGRLGNIFKVEAPHEPTHFIEVNDGVGTRRG